MIDKTRGECLLTTERDSLVPWQHDAINVVFQSEVLLVRAKQNLVFIKWDLLVNGVHASWIKVK